MATTAHPYFTEDSSQVACIENASLGESTRASDNDTMMGMSKRYMDDEMSQDELTLIEEIKLINEDTNRATSKRKRSRKTKTRRKRGNSLEREISQLILRTALGGASRSHFAVSTPLGAPVERAMSVEYILEDLGQHATGGVSEHKLTVLSTESVEESGLGEHSASEHDLEERKVEEALLGTKYNQTASDNETTLDIMKTSSKEKLPEETEVHESYDDESLKLQNSKPDDEYSLVLPPSTDVADLPSCEITGVDPPTSDPTVEAGTQSLGLGDPEQEDNNFSPAVSFDAVSWQGSNDATSVHNITPPESPTDPPSQESSTVQSLSHQGDPPTIKKHHKIAEKSRLVPKPKATRMVPKLRAKIPKEDVIFKPNFDEWTPFESSPFRDDDALGNDPFFDGSEPIDENGFIVRPFHTRESQKYQPPFADTKWRLRDSIRGVNVSSGSSSEHRRHVGHGSYAPNSPRNSVSQSRASSEHKRRMELHGSHHPHSPDSVLDYPSPTFGSRPERPDPPATEHLQLPRDKV